MTINKIKRDKIFLFGDIDDDKQFKKETEKSLVSLVLVGRKRELVREID